MPFLLWPHQSLEVPEVIVLTAAPTHSHITNISHNEMDSFTTPRVRTHYSTDLFVRPYQDLTQTSK